MKEHQPHFYQCKFPEWHALARSFASAIIFCIGSLLLCPLLSFSATYPVNSEEGAQSRLDSAVPGDTIIIEDGDYADFMLTVSSNGADGNPITLRAETGGGVNFTGLSGFFVTGDYVVIDGFQFTEVPRMSEAEGRVVRFDGANFSKLTNCAFYNCGNDRFRHIVLLTEGSANNEVSYNYLENIVGQGIGVTGEEENNNNYIHHNWINGTQDDGEFNGQEPIQVGQSTDQYSNNLNTLVEFNLIENMSDEDKADSELISNKTAGNTLRFNTTRNNAPRMEIVLRGGEDCVVENNYLIGNGIRAYGNGHVIRNNYSQDARYGVRLPGGDASGDTGSYSETFNCTVANNLVVNSEREGIRIGDTGDNLGGPFIQDITISDNEVQTDRGTMYFLQEPNGGNITWSGNVGEGSAVLKTDNITSGVVRGEVDETTELTPLTEDEVGPDWLDSDGGGTPDAPGIFLEAETCGLIGSNWEVKDDPAASGGQYVEIADGNTSQPEPPTAPEDRISYSVEVDEAGRYALWGRVLTPSDSDDSFWVRVNGGDWQIWFTGVEPDWAWVRNANYDLTAGSNTVDIAYREDGSQLDKLYLTKDGDTPTGLGGDGTDCEVPTASGDIVIRAKGSCGSETMVLQIDGEDVQVWTNVATNFTDYTYEGYEGGVIKVRFTNDGRDKKKNKKDKKGKNKKNKGCDRNLIVDKITVCGTPVEAEDAIRTSCGPPSQWLWCNGNFNFGNVGCGAPAESGTLSIRARGTCGLETMVLQIDRQDAQTWTNVTTNFANYTYEGYSGGTVEVFFTNDGTTGGCDKNLIVDKIMVCGTTVEAEDAVRSSCGPPSQWLYCNGSFNFGDVGCGASNARTAEAVTKEMGERQDTSLSFETYPNPATEHLTISGPETYGLSLYDLSGYKVLERSGLHRTSAIDVQHLQPGIYIIQLHGTQQPSLRQRLIIE